MPNWCENLIYAAGKPAAIKALNKWLGKDGFLLNKVLPMPAKLEGTTFPSSDKKTKEAAALIKKFGFDNWYDWKVANWGTKWDIEAETTPVGKNNVQIGFDSAWSPPTKVTLALSKRFPTLRFTHTYAEFGMMFAGRYIAEGGEEIEDDCTEDVNSSTWQEVAVDTFGYEPFVDDEVDD